MNSSHSNAVLLFAILALAPLAVAQEPLPRPAYKFLRQDEDWSRFVQPEGGAALDSFKRIAVDDSGNLWLSFGGRAEARFEAWDGFGFGAVTPGNEDEFLLSRLMLHADAHFGSVARVFVEGITAQSTDRDLPGGRRTLDMDSLDLQQAFLDVTPDPERKLRLRLGRQAFSFGNQRLVSALPWANTLNRWEGLSVLGQSGPWQVHGLLTWYVPVDKTEANERDDDRSLYGVYATRTPEKGGVGLDLYLLGDTRPNLTINGTSGDERRHTFGARGWGPFAERGDWEVEAAWQFGEVGSADVSAWMLTAVGGWKFPDGAGTPRLFAGLDLASGDSASGGDVGTFHQLYPLGHAHLGFADVIGRQNIAAANVGVGWTLGPATTLAATAHAFRLMDTDDALYGVGGTVSRAGGFDSADVGQELDVLLRHKLSTHFDVYAGYSHFFSGAAIAEGATDDDIDFAYVGAAFTF